MAMRVGIPRDIGCQEGSLDFLDNDMVGRERQRLAPALNQAPRDKM